MWSPTRNANGARNQFYENMRSVAPGDIIFSFYDIRINAIGVATASAETDGDASGRVSVGAYLDVETNTTMPAASTSQGDGLRGLIPDRHQFGRSAKGPVSPTPHVHSHSVAAAT